MSARERVKLEIYIARPPTSKCREVIAVMEEMLRRYPEQTRLVVFERGAPWPEEPSPALKFAFQKGSTVPMCYVDGRFVVGGKVPALDEVEKPLLQSLAEQTT